MDTNTATLFTAISEVNQKTSCVVVSREKNLYKLDFPDAVGLNEPKHLHKTIHKYRILKIIVSKHDDRLLALGTKRANHRIVVVEISMPNSRDPLGFKELAQLPRLFDYDDFTVRLVDGETNRHLLVAALVEPDCYAIHKVLLPDLYPSPTI